MYKQNTLPLTKLCDLQNKIFSFNSDIPTFKGLVLNKTHNQGLTPALAAFEEAKQDIYLQT